MTSIQISEEAGKVFFLVFPSVEEFSKFVVIHTVKGFGLVNKAKVDVFLELSSFFYDPMDVGNLISGSSAFSKSSLNMWNLLIHILLKPQLENFEHYFASRWDECNCSVLNILWHCLSLGLEWKHLFQSCGHCWVFPICWHIECSCFTASSLKIWNSSTGIPSPPLALFTVMLPKAHLTSHLGCLAIGEWSHRHGYLDHEDLFCVVICVLATSS